ncbi:MAG: RluA family pseudouridine synthase [Rickettsiaceae bacterium]|nr:RluA family pseudouridine synthase [Rickettsiaceae bacterium]
MNRQNNRQFESISSHKTLVNVVLSCDQSMRLDRYLKIQYPHFTQGQIEKKIRQKDIKLNNQKTSAKTLLKNADIIEIYDPSINNRVKDVKTEFSQSVKSLATKIIGEYKIFEDENILVINKPSGLGSQGGEAMSISIAEALEYLNYKTLKDHVNEGYKIVHRLDKETSGVFLIAKTRLAATKITKAFSERKIEKEYIAILDGIPEQKKGIIKNYLRKNIKDKKQYILDKNDDTGEYAETLYSVMAESDIYNICLVKFLPKTGRMHQLRVHAVSIGCPIYGDKKYNIKANNAKHLLLHAYKISLDKTIIGKDYEFYAPIPAHFKKILQIFNQGIDSDVKI